VIDDRVASMSPGEVLLDVPMADIIERTGRAIADAQLRLDELSIRTALLLGESRLDFRNSAGALVSRSLLELGFTPTFYAFTDTTITIFVTLSIRVEETFRVGGAVSFGTFRASGTGATGAAVPGLPSAPTGPTGPPGSRPGTSSSAGTPAGAISAAQSLLRPGTFAQEATMFGLTISADYHRRYDFNTTASSKVETKMVAVPAPSAFLEALRATYRVTTP
jgi:hypothetical protein